MQLILLLVLKRSRAHAALERILVDVRLDVRLQVVRLCKLLLANLRKKDEKSEFPALQSFVHPTHITFVGLGVRVLLHMLVEIALNIEHFIADGAHVRLLLGVLAHVSEKLVERRERLVAHAAVGWMIIAVRPQVRRQIVLLVKALITKRTFCVGGEGWL